MKSLIGIDIGVLHLGLAFASTNDDYSSLKIEKTVLIDMTTECSSSGCSLFHTGFACDRVLHVIQAHQKSFDDCDHVVIERQPPTGIRDVEQVFAALFRPKAIIVQPQTMHAYIGSSGFDYDRRKDLATKFACRYVPDIEDRYERAHDVADAVCLVATVRSQLFTKAIEARLKSEAKTRQAAAKTSTTLDLDRFRYVEQSTDVKENT